MIGVSKLFQHSNILKVLGVLTIDNVIKNNALGLYKSFSEQISQQETCNHISTSKELSSRDPTRQDSINSCGPSGQYMVKVANIQMSPKKLKGL